MVHLRATRLAVTLSSMLRGATVHQETAAPRGRQPVHVADARRGANTPVLPPATHRGTVVSYAVGSVTRI